MTLQSSDCRQELWRGVVHAREFLGFAGGCVTNRLMWEVGMSDEAQGCFQGLAGGTGFLVERNPDTVIAPNGAFLRKERLPFTDEYLAVAPDIVIETWTPNASTQECVQRAEWWLNFGVRLVIEINTRRQLVALHRSGQPGQELSLNDTLEAEDILPGFTLPLRRLFRDITT